MAEPREIQPGDAITINEEPFDGESLRVSDTETTDIGLATIFVASLVLGCDIYTLSHAEGSREVSLEHEEADQEHRISIDSIRIQ